MDKLLDILETAQRMRVAPPTLNRWRVEGVGPKFVKIGRRVFYRPSDLDDYIAGRLRSSTSDAGRTGRAA